MTEKMIENRVKKLRAIEAQQKELEAAADAIRAELKADLEEKGVEELKTQNFILRWKEIVSSRLDGNPPNTNILIRQKENSFFAKILLLYPEPGSNRHGLLHWCLRPARLPIPPSGLIVYGLSAL